MVTLAEQRRYAMRRAGQALGPARACSFQPYFTVLHSECPHETQSYTR